MIWAALVIYTMALVQGARAKTAAADQAKRAGR